jgi:hypothetical protein
MQAASLLLVVALRLKPKPDKTPLLTFEVAHASRRPSPFLAGLTVSMSAPKVDVPSTPEALKTIPGVLPSALPQHPNINSLPAVVTALTAGMTFSTAVPIAVPETSNVGVPVKPLTST